VESFPASARLFNDRYRSFFQLFRRVDETIPRHVYQGRSCVGLPFNTNRIHGTVILEKQTAQFGQFLIVRRPMGKNVCNRPSVISNADLISFLNPPEVSKKPLA